MLPAEKRCLLLSKVFLAIPGKSPSQSNSSWISVHSAEISCHGSITQTINVASWCLRISRYLSQGYTHEQVQSEGKAFSSVQSLWCEPIFVENPCASCWLTWHTEISISPSKTSLSVIKSICSRSFSAQNVSFNRSGADNNYQYPLDGRLPFLSLFGCRWLPIPILDGLAHFAHAPFEVVAEPWSAMRRSSFHYRHHHDHCQRYPQRSHTKRCSTAWPSCFVQSSETTMRRTSQSSATLSCSHCPLGQGHRRTSWSMRTPRRSSMKRWVALRWRNRKISIFRASELAKLNMSSESKDLHTQAMRPSSMWRLHEISEPEIENREYQSVTRKTSWESPPSSSWFTTLSTMTATSTWCSSVWSCYSWTARHRAVQAHIDWRQQRHAADQRHLIQVRCFDCQHPGPHILEEEKRPPPPFRPYKGPKSPYEWQFCAKIDREGPCSKAAGGA